MIVLWLLFSAKTKVDTQAFGLKLGEELVVEETLIVGQKLSVKTCHLIFNNRQTVKPCQKTRSCQSTH